MSKQPVSIDPDERIFTLQDIAQLVRSLKSKLIQRAIIGFLLAAGFCLLKPVKYQVEATFKESAEKSGAENSLKDLIGGMGVGAAQPQAAALMQSYQVLKPLVQKLGLQAQVIRSILPIRILKRMRDNIQAELGNPLQEIDWFVFKNVSYEKEDPLSYLLQFSDLTHFSILTAAGEFLEKGELGKIVDLGSISFIVEKTPSRLFLGKKYSLQFCSWLKVAKELRDGLSITSHKSNRTIYDLSISRRDRKEASDILNGLMEEYQFYLKRDHNQVAAEQIAYLQTKQSEMYSNMAALFDEHTQYLKESVGEKGFFALEQETKSILEPLDKLRASLVSIDVELAQLEQMKNPELIEKESMFGRKISETMKRVQQLEKERDFIQISLAPFQTNDGLDLRMEELAAVRSERESMEQLFREIKEKKELSLPSEFGWAKPYLNQSQNVDFPTYIGNQIRLLGMREKVLGDRLSNMGPLKSQFAGIDLLTAHEIYAQYNKKLDEAEELISYFNHLKEEIKRPDFELSSLSIVLQDPLSAQWIARASEVALKLKDERYRSSKEETRWNEEVSFERKILSDHLEQLSKIQELNAELVREKMIALQQRNVDCLNQELAVLHGQVEETLSSRKESLSQEKEILLKKMEEIRLSASDLPERWKLEKWLKLKTDMGTKIMGVMTELVESKTIAHHLHHVQSKPLDFAALPLLPNKPRIFVMSILGAFGLAFALFFSAFMKNLLHGFPTNSEKLKAMKLPFSGEMSFFCDGPKTELISGPDLETLRELSLFLKQGSKGEVIALIGGKGPDYSYSFAQNLARTGLRTVLIRCDFSPKFSPADRPGLFQWLQSEMEEVPLRRGDQFDYIPSGGFSSFGVEALQSKRMEELLTLCRQSYDRVIIWLRSPIDAMQTKILLPLSQKAIVTVSGEKIEQLTPFVDWAYHEGNIRLTFISAT